MNVTLAAAGSAMIAMSVLVPLGSASTSGSGPDVTLSTSALSFAGRALGTRADAQMVQFTNSGTSPVTISTFRINGADAGDFAQGNTCPVSPDAIPAGGACEIYVSFTPHSSGSKSAALAIGDDAVSGPQTVTLSGIGISAPQVSLAPGALAFGAILAGDLSSPQTVTLTNTGSATLALSAIRLSGAAAADFSRTTTCDLSTGVPAGTSCTIDIVFAPQSAGDKSVTLMLDDDAPDTPQSVTLTGTGLTASGPALSFSPAALDFGTLTASTEISQRSLSITNTGGAALSIASIGVSGDSEFTLQSNDCPASVAPGATCSARLVFAPVGPAGTRSAALTVSDNAGGSPHSAPLSGTVLPTGIWFSDDFESGSLGEWSAQSSNDSTIALDSAVAHAGGSSVRLGNGSDGQSSRLYADLAGGGHPQSYTRFCFRVAPGLTQGIVVASGRAITSDDPLGVRRWEIDYNPGAKGLEGYFFNEQLQRVDLYAAGGQVLTGHWYCAELYLDESTNGHAQLWLDGVSVGSVDGDLATPNPYSRLYLWNQAAAGTVWFDDVKVAGTQNGAVAGNLGTSPAAALGASALDFGSENIGVASVPKVVSITSTGSDLHIGSIGVGGANAPDFSQTNDCPAVLPGGASCTATVTFAATAAGARSALLTVIDDAGDSPQTVALAGIGVIPGTYFSDDFESGSLGYWGALSSSDSTIAPDPTIANSGGSSVRFTNASSEQSSRLMADLAGGGHAQTYTRFCFRIAPGLTQGIEIANGRAINAEYPLGIRRFVIDYNPVTKGLEGYFFNEALQRLDMSAANGRVLTGRWYCAELYLDERADGHARLWLDGVPVGSADGDLSTPYPYGRLYLWNQAAAGTVWFDDVKVAAAQIGPLGAGAADLPGPQVGLSSSTLGFGAQTARTTSAGQSVTLTNTGESALTITNVAVAGTNAGDFAQTSTCPLAPATLAVGSSCDANVTFTPSATGSSTAVLAFTDDASGTPHTVALSGTGTAPATAVATLSPSSLSFGDRVVNTASTVLPVTLTNTGTLPMSIGAVTVTGDNASDFAQANDCPTGSATLGVGASCTISVTLTPAASGSRTAALSVTSDATNSPATVALTGVGVLPAGTFLSDGFEGGLVSWAKVGDGTETAQSAIVHRGNAAAALTNAAAGGYAGIYADFAGQGQAQSVTRFCFNLGGVTSPSVLAQGRDGNGMNIWEIDYDPGREGLDIYVWNGARVRTDLYTATNVLVADRWYCAEVALGQLAAGHVEVSIDGASTAAADGDYSATSNYSRLFLWNNGAGGTVTVDDVSVTAP